MQPCAAVSPSLPKLRAEGGAVNNQGGDTISTARCRKDACTHGFPRLELAEFTRADSGALALS